MGIARGRGTEVDLAEFAEFDVPLYNFDLQQAEGIPRAAQELGRRIQAADGLLIASPEYNFSLPGTLKNLIDWVSRIRPVPLRGKHGLLLAASTGAVGGIRGLWQLRIPLEGLGLILSPDMFALAHADKAFTEAGELTDPCYRGSVDQDGRWVSRDGKEAEWGMAVVGYGLSSYRLSVRSCWAGTLARQSDRPRCVTDDR